MRNTESGGNNKIFQTLIRFYPSGEAFGTASDDATVSTNRSKLHKLSSLNISQFTFSDTVNRIFTAGKFKINYSSADFINNLTIIIQLHNCASVCLGISYFGESIDSNFNAKGQNL